MYIINENDFLARHGIIGMKWGVRHGPPYPLDSKASTGNQLKKAPKSVPLEDILERYRNSRK